ncbi:MAG: prolyl oligopeptidase family serine peptidase [Marinirhabdus sp.]|nr:prolyl oligopeptidase family serine peptidase [Marinirhabdus sp.]
MATLLKIVVFCGFSLVLSTLHGQQYVGEVLLGNTYQYAKIEVSDSLATFSLPYLDKDKKYPVLGNINKDWHIQRSIETWKFSTSNSEIKLKGTLSRNGTVQPIAFFKQLPALPENELKPFEGVYADAQGHRAVIYAKNGYLHFISPYSERSMSLKPIGEHQFWSVSGEHTSFMNLGPSGFETMTLFNRFQHEVRLKKLPPIRVEERFIPVGRDSLFAKIFIPAETKLVPACLILPGGGAVGMDNYEFEARYLAAQGMLAMLFDKPGNGKSKGSGNFQAQSFEEKNDQYLELFKYLQAHPKVDKSRVGVHGPSEGGRLALMMAIDEPQIAFVNATAAPIMSMREGQLYAIDHYLRNRGIDEQDVIAIRNIWNEYYEGIITENIKSETIERANIFREKYERLFIPPNTQEIPLTPSASDLQNDRVAVEASKISCPVFLQYGENDKRVHPEKSLANFFKYANKDVPVSVSLYPRANHSFMTPEYEISHGYLHDKLEWLQQIGILK